MNKKIGIFMVFVLLVGAVFLSACNQEAVGRKISNLADNENAQVLNRGGEDRARLVTYSKENTVYIPIMREGDSYQGIRLEDIGEDDRGYLYCDFSYNGGGTNRISPQYKVEEFRRIEDGDGGMSYIAVFGIYPEDNECRVIIIK